jgi:hypothetical protein
MIFFRIVLLFLFPSVRLEIILPTSTAELTEITLLVVFELLLYLNIRNT